MAKKKEIPTMLYVKKAITYRKIDSEHFGKRFHANHPDALDFSHLSAGARQRLIDSKILSTTQPTVTGDTNG